MTDIKRSKRFLNTMDEIIEQLKLNTQKINVESVLNLIDLILEVKNTEQMVFVYGAGRSGFVGRCFAQRLMHLGIKACFISDAITHQYTQHDLVVIISGSGETTSPVAIAQKANMIGGRIALFTGNPNSSIGSISDCIIKVEGKSKDIAVSKHTLAPYTSLFDISTLSILDSIGGTLMDLLGVTEADIDRRHATLE
ncbi:MAG: SIS domain-containing protein [Promethearchaeota archaeon]|nr:MAG: SIS domain-containing protein [Candidatus Lokiarchaeota archaeon]